MNSLLKTSSFALEKISMIGTWLTSY